MREPQRQVSVVQMIRRNSCFETGVYISDRPTRSVPYIISALCVNTYCNAAQKAYGSD